MVRLFHASVRQATHRGLLQGYRTRDEALNVVRGRIRIDDQLRRRFGLAFPIEVRYDEFTPDIEHNRLLKAAVRRLARLPLRSPKSRQLLSAMRAVFVNVSDVEYRPHALPDLPVNPLNAHYQPALALARLILSSGAVELAAGQVRASALLIDMNRVFEDFVVVALREELRLTEYAFPQQARRTPISGSTPRRPDAAETRPVMVGRTTAAVCRRREIQAFVGAGCSQLRPLSGLWPTPWQPVSPARC